MVDSTSLDRDAPDYYDQAARLALGDIAQFATKAGVHIEGLPWAPYGQTLGIEITDLVAETPGQGHGSAVMRQLEQICNDLGLTTYLRPDGPRSRDFYVRHGFLSDSRRNPGFMVRFPKFEFDDDVRHSFAGPGAKTAYLQFMEDAKSMEAQGSDRESIWRQTGWFKWTDGKWRFEISDDDARILPALKTLARGEIAPTRIKSISYRRNDDGTFDASLAPPQPQKTSDFIHLTHVEASVLRAVVPEDVFDRLESGEGEPDYIGNFEEAKRLPAEFDFDGMNVLPLDQVLEHPALFAAYPSLSDILVQVDPKLRLDGALIQHDGGTLIRVGIGQQLSAILHEVEHAIQFIEGFAPGGSPHTIPDEEAEPIRAARHAAAILDRDQALAAYRQNPSPDLWDAYCVAGDRLNAIAPSPQTIDRATAYHRLAGEVESRNTDARQRLTDYERLKTPPWTTADTPESLIITRAPSPLTATPQSMRKAVIDAIGAFPNEYVATTSRRIQLNWGATPSISNAQPSTPPRILEAARRRAAQGFHDPKSQRTYFICDQIPAGNELSVFLHEIIHKHGRRVLPQRQWSQMVGTVASWIHWPMESDENSIYLKAHARAKAGSNEEHYEEELFAYAVEEAVSRGITPSADAAKDSAEQWLQTVIDSIERVGDVLTGKRTHLSGQDVVDFAYALAQLDSPTHREAIESALKQYLVVKPGNSPEFKAWFQDSVIRNPDGSPKVLYHGTSKDFSEFRGDRITWGSIDPVLANQYADTPDDGRVMPIYMRAQAPLRIENGAQSIKIGELMSKALLQAQERGFAVDMQSAKAHFDAVKMEWERINFTEAAPVFHHWLLCGPVGFYKLRDYMQVLGFDSLSMEENGHETFGAFDPKAVKSAVGNNGEFSRDNADIRYSAQPQTETPAFRQWFGDSKVVDADGNPLVVYHGYGGRKFNIFREKYLGRHNDNALSKTGFFFSPDYQTADDYAYQAAWNLAPEDKPFNGEGQNIHAVYLSLQNPLEIDGAKFGNYTDEVNRLSAVVREAKSNGHDGVILRGWEDGSGNYDQYIAFRPEQIKSAIDNNGEFDVSNPDIRYSQKSDVTPIGFFSALARGIESIKMTTAPADGWKDVIKGLINKGQVKADEVEWTGINEWLDLQTGKITKEQVAEFLDANGVQLHEVQLGGIASLKARAKKLGYDVGHASTGNFELYDERNEPIHEDDLTSELKSIREDLQRTQQPKYFKYTLSGGDNYRELLLTLNKNDSGQECFAFQQWLKDVHGMAYSDFEDEPQEAQDHLLEAFDESGRNPEFRSGHWEYANILAHIRLNDRTDAEGKRVLFIEEIQSDWAQKGKKAGFQLTARQKDALEPGSPQAVMALAKGLLGDMKHVVDDGFGNPVVQTMQAPKSDALPPAPFVTKTDAWLTLALKRIMKLAVDEGFDKVAFISGEQSADRYDLSKEVSRIDWTGDSKGWKSVTITHYKGNDAEFRVRPDGSITGFGHEDTGNEYSGKSLDQVVGKDIAERIQEERDGQLSGNGLKVGGKGMVAFYDTIVPSTLNKLLRKYGDAQLETVGVGMGTPRKSCDAYGCDTSEIQIYRDASGNFMVKKGDAFIRTGEGKYWTGHEWSTDDGQSRVFNSEEAAAASVTATPQLGFTVTRRMREMLSDGMPLFSLAPTEDEVALPIERMRA